jgi:hypothetical protein
VQTPAALFQNIGIPPLRRLAGAIVNLDDGMTGADPDHDHTRRLWRRTQRVRYEFADDDYPVIDTSREP